MKIILLSILVGAVTAREYHYPQPQISFITGAQTAAGHAHGHSHNHLVPREIGNQQTFIVHTLSNSRQAYELQMSKAQQVYEGHVGGAPPAVPRPQYYQQHTVLQQQQRQQHTINRNPLLPAVQLVQTHAPAAGGNSFGPRGFAPTQAQVTYNQPRFPPPPQVQLTTTYGPPGSSAAGGNAFGPSGSAAPQPDQLPISYGPPASPPPAPGQLPITYGPPASPPPAPGQLPNTYGPPRSQALPLAQFQNNLVPQSASSSHPAPINYDAQTSPLASPQALVSYGPPEPPLPSPQAPTSYGPPSSLSTAQQPSIVYGSPAQAQPLISNDTPELANSHDQTGAAPPSSSSNVPNAYGSATANTGNHNNQQASQQNLINSQPYNIVQLSNGQRIQDGGHGAGSQQHDGGPSRTGDYHSQSQASQLDYYQYKQRQPGDARDFQRFITTCDPSGQCHQIALGPGQADPGHEQLLLAARAQTTPHEHRCKQFAAERAAQEAAYAGGSYQRGSAADAAAAAAAGTPVSTRGAERNAQGQLRPRDRRFYQYSESIIPRDPFN